MNGFVAGFVGENDIFEGDAGTAAAGRAGYSTPHAAFRARPADLGDKKHASFLSGPGRDPA